MDVLEQERIEQRNPDAEFELLFRQMNHSPDVQRRFEKVFAERREDADYQRHLERLTKQYFRKEENRRFVAQQEKNNLWIEQMMLEALE